MFSSVRLIVIIVGLAALIVGGSLFYKYNPGSKPSPSVSPDQSTSKVNNQLNESTSSTQVPRAKTNLPSPPPVASGAALDKYVQEIQQVAVEADALEITNCTGKPASIRMKKGSKLTIKNSDSKEITIFLNTSNTYTVPASSSQTFTVQAGSALYSYICSQKDGVTLRGAGALEVIP